MMEKQKRIPLWDNIKFILIVLVVIGHFINIRNSVTYHSIFIFIYSFHMPLFIFLAGLFHKNTGVWKKALAFLGIYIVYELSIFGIKKLFHVKGAKLDFFHESAAPWFMLAMVYYVLMGFLLHKLMENAYLKWMILVFFIILACLSGYVESIGSFLSLAKVINFFPFYLLGIILDRKKLEEYSTRKPLKLAGLAILAVWFIICFVFRDQVYLFRPFMVAKASYMDYYNVPYLWRISSYAIAVICGAALIFATPVKEISLFTVWGSRTVQVYFWHKLVLYVLKYTDTDEWFYDGGLHKTLWIITAIAITCILSLPIFKYPTELILGFTRSSKKEQKG